MSKYPLFSVVGIEIEYMLVDKDTLNVSPKADLILEALAGSLQNEVALGDIAVSNELVMHVLELKTNGPALPTAPLALRFQDAILKIKPILDTHNITFLPTSAHPWMNPLSETKRWMHGNSEIYQQFDKIFSCSGHGWSNLQTMHINLPFSSDAEFEALHSAIRLILPLLPALAASSPFLDGKCTGIKDSRLAFYGNNQKIIPSISGAIIPEFIRTPKEYTEKILNTIYDDIKPYDPEGILQHEWLNSRAAMPKFNYNAIEIRILDSQECVDADLAIAMAIFHILKYWISESRYFLDKPCETERLKKIYDQTLQDGFDVKITDEVLLKQWQLPTSLSSTRDIWAALIAKISHLLDAKSQRILEFILSQGSLSERILKACGSDYSHKTLKTVYTQLSSCLLTNSLLEPL